MDTDKDLKYKIHYFCREKYYQTMENIALEGIKKFPDDPSFKLYSGIALYLSGRIQESMRELEPLTSSKSVNVGTLLTLIAAHKACQNVDKEALVQLDSKLKSERKAASDFGLYYGALFLFFNNKIDKSKEYLDRYLKNNPDSTEGQTLKGWVEIFSDKKSKSAAQYFNTVLEKEKKNMDATLGLVKLKEQEKDFDGGISLLNQLIVKYPSLLPPLIEKMKMQLACTDWDLTIEIANRILTIDNKCLEALRMKTLVLICRDGNFEETAISLRRLYGETEKYEPKNAKLFLENAQLFSYLSGKNPKILSETYRFAEKAAQLDPTNVDFITELGYQNLLQKKVKEASKFFRTTTKLDDSSITALTGLTLCQILEGGVNEQIKQQVEFLREVQSDQPTSELLLMSAKLAVTPEDAIGFLNLAIQVHFEKFKKYPYGIRYLYYLNPGFLMEVVKEYLKYAPSNLSASTYDTIIPEPLAKSLSILEEITVSCPGLLEAQYEYAHVQYLTGNIKGAKATLGHILDVLDATSADAHILMAQIHLQQKNYQQGAQSLEVGLSYNFKIREHPLYHLINAMVHKENGNIIDCINSLKMVMSASGLKSSGTKAEVKPSEFELSLSDRVMLYLELADAYQLNNQVQEASKIIQEAMEQFQGTSEEGRMAIANAELSVQRGNINHAVELLQKIQPGQSYYAMATKVLANIYLVHKKDRESFAECYKNLVENCPNAETYVMLGDAYMSIQETELAIDAYEQALKLNSKDNNLVCKMGKALVKTHHFTKAINFYKESIKNDGNLDLIYDMAELYFKLGQLDNAERILVTELENGKVDYMDIRLLTSRTKLLQLLAKLRDKSGNLTESLSALKSAKENHNRIDKRILAQSDEHKETISNICSDMAVLMTRLRDFNGAIKSYKEALAVKPGDPKVLVALSRLYMQVNDLEECQLTSKRLLAADPNNESATIMLADLAFRKVDFETAAYHFKQLLTKRPTYWTALARLVEVMRRTGNLEEVVPYLEKGETASLRPEQEAGYSYCKGLFEWYSGKPTSALHHFNRARRDSEWGQQAIYNMVEICLNPESDTLGGEAFSEDGDDEDIQDSKEMALRTAQRLLTELKPRQGTEEALTHRLLENFWLLATKQKSNIEKGLQDFLSIASQEVYRDHVGVNLGIATAYMLQKQVQKARNQLKRLIKSQWSFEDAEYLERSWLLLTDIYIQSGKMDLPADLIQRILQHNRSCYKAYEYAGYIAEKEQLYKDAAVQYENAWRYGGQSNPAIGYKLAFNYLKGKRYADAIDICHTILKLYPDYPRIHKDILEKARNNLRT